MGADMKADTMINLLKRPIQMRLWFHRYRYWVLVGITCISVFAISILGGFLYDYWTYNTLVTNMANIQANTEYIQLQHELQKLKLIEREILKPMYGQNRHLIMVLLDSANQLNHPQQQISFTKIIANEKSFSIDGQVLNIQVYDTFKQKLMEYLRGYDIHGKQDAPKNSEMVGFHLEGHRRDNSRTD